MTTRLLRASLGSPTYDGMRETLVSNLHTVLYEARGLRVTGRALPLLRRRADGGGLEQAVRFTVTAPAGAAVDLELRAGGAAGDRATVELAGGSGTADLFVPEVTAPTLAEVTISDASGQLRSVEMPVHPQRKWTVHMVHHSHLDIGYTDRQGTVLRHHSEYLDSALDLAEATDSWPQDARFRWTVESALPLRRWLAGRAPSTRSRFVDLARAGRIEVTAMPFQLHTEACSTEELHRLLRFTDDLRTDYGIPVTSAMHTDVPGAVVGFVDALASAGVRYLSAAHNWAGRSVPFLVGGQELARPFWWRAPSGNRVLVWVTDTPHGMAYMEGNIVGLAEGYGSTLDLLPNYLDGLANRPFPYGGEAFGWAGLPDEELSKTPYAHDLLHLRVQGGPADNAGPSIVPATVARRWNETWEWPRLRAATNTDFFTEAEQRFGADLAEHTGDWTDWWADGLGSGARPLGYNRRAQNAVRQAESLHTLAGDDTAMPRIDAVYDRLGLFDEHTWGAANPWSDAEDGFDSGGLQWARKCELAYQATDDAFDLLADGAARLGTRFTPAPGTAASFLLVNTGHGRRSDVAEFFVPASTIALDQPFTVHDARTGEVLPHHAEVSEPLENPTRPYGRRVQVLVTDVPSVGWVRLDLAPGGETPRAERITQGGADGAAQVENEFYRVEYDLENAVIRSVFDKQAGRELVNTESPAGFGQYIYDRYSTAPHVNHLSGHIQAGADDLSLLASRTLGRRASVVRAERTAVGETLVVQTDGDGADWIRTTITLRRGVRRVDITNRIAKRGAPAKESVFFAFPLAVGPAPAPVWELTGGVGGDRVPVVPGAAHHMRPIRHWVGFGDEDFSVAWATLEAPLVMFGDLYLPYAPFPATVNPAESEPGTVYSWALNNIWDTNFPAQQQGETTFRYAITSASGQAPGVLGPQASAGLTDPLVAVPATAAAQAGPRPSGAEQGAVSAAAPEGLFAGVDHESVFVSSIGASRRGHDTVVYLRSVADQETQVELRLPMPARAAYVGTTLERDLREVPVSGSRVRVTVPAHGHIAVAVDAAPRP
ncbi:glycoside hydrolase family 38 C-terminal domain-containing protein [Streptomyces sp. NPDC049040]|uniref:glycoside hydrolase family 38 N-terminal domain-containing protein n=1 Tax=Streptomyces sp. NPDC049040 TaxID=3365593 RepID=UPI003710DF77